MQRTVVLLIAFFLFFSASSSGQDSVYVKWTSTSKKITSGVFELYLKGIISKDWHLYSENNKIEGLKGIEISVSDPLVKITDSATIKGDVKTRPDPIFENKPASVLQNDVELIQKIKIETAVPASLKVKVSYNVGSADAFIPEEQTIAVNLEGGVAASNVNRIRIPSIDLQNPGNSCGDQSKEKGLFALFLLGFLSGMIALITPCVFPMIPLTVSFFTKSSETKRKGVSSAITYGSFIFFIYVALSLPFYFIDKLNPEILNNISTNVYVNVAFFIIFVFFAFSFLGYYEIRLPHHFSSRADSRAGTTDLFGIFFMALTLALVSFSCTGPILGSLLAGSLSGNGGAVQLTAGMGGFGLALAFPFALFALFPNWLNSLPKSGGWLNTVKVVLGFVELALAFKFLSNADLVHKCANCCRALP